MFYFKILKRSLTEYRINKVPLVDVLLTRTQRACRFADFYVSDKEQELQPSPGLFNRQNNSIGTKILVFKNAH